MGLIQSTSKVWHENTGYQLVDKGVPFLKLAVGFFFGQKIGQAKSIYIIPLKLLIFTINPSALQKKAYTTQHRYVSLIRGIQLTFLLNSLIHYKRLAKFSKKVPLSIQQLTTQWETLWKEQPIYEEYKQLVMQQQVYLIVGLTLPGTYLFTITEIGIPTGPLDLIHKVSIWLGITPPQ